MNFETFILTILFKNAKLNIKKKKKKKKRKSNPSFPELWVGRKRANKHLFFFFLGLRFWGYAKEKENKNKNTAFN